MKTFYKFASETNNPTSAMIQDIPITNLRIAVTDGNDFIREGIRAVLTENGIGCISTHGKGEELIGAVSSGNNPDIHILDIEQPDMDGFTLIEKLRNQDAEARIIICTTQPDIWTIRKLLEHNVNAIILKSGESEELLKCVGDVSEGQRYYCQELDDIIKNVNDNSLHPTARELEVLFLIAQGKTSREIAVAMLVTENTIEAHRKALFSKLNAVNVADLVMKAISKGYIRHGGNSQRQ